MLASTALRPLLRASTLLPRLAATVAISSAAQTRAFASVRKESPNPSDPNSPEAKVSSSPEAEPILPTDATASTLEQTPETTRAPPQEPFSSSDPAANPDVAPEAEPKTSPGGGGRKGDGLPDSAYVSSTDRRRNAMAKYSAYGALLGLVGGTLYLGRSLDEKEKKAHPSIGDGWDSFFARVNARRRDFLDFYNEPPFEKLLPDPVPIPEYSRPYTLVIGLEDLMVHSEWSREHGWRIAKRPGLDYFLAYLFQYYEIVVFTNQPDHMAIPIVQKVDQYPGYIMHQLFRAHTRYVDGKYVKDLNYINRPLSKVIMLETNPDAWSANPSNTIKLPPWTGDPKDKTLVSLIPFLEYIAAMGISDVRPVIEDLEASGRPIPVEFARREELLREEMRRQLGGKKKSGGPPDWLLAFLGMKTKAERGDDVKTFTDLARERGLQNYEETQKHIREHKDEMIKEQQSLEKEMADQMKTSLSKIFTEGLPKPPGQQ